MFIIWYVTSSVNSLHFFPNSILPHQPEVTCAYPTPPDHPHVRVQGRARRARARFDGFFYSIVGISSKDFKATVCSSFEFSLRCTNPSRMYSNRSLPCTLPPSTTLTSLSQVVRFDCEMQHLLCQSILKRMLVASKKKYVVISDPHRYTLTSGLHPPPQVHGYIVKTTGLRSELKLW